MNKQFKFHKSCDDDVRKMAIFVSTLEKEQIEYRVDESMDHWIIEITGH